SSSCLSIGHRMMSMSDSFTGAHPDSWTDAWLGVIKVWRSCGVVAWGGAERGGGGAGRLAGARPGVAGRARKGKVGLRLRFLGG
ncbi:MAG TPA: hypothetical protein VFJ06_00420, partial [Halococcus sp.]|nr:hypothetical protein [Halococcus sp.]